MNENYRRTPDLNKPANPNRIFKIAVFVFGNTNADTTTNTAWIYTCANSLNNAYINTLRHFNNHFADLTIIRMELMDSSSGQVIDNNIIEWLHEDE